jgi:renalase
MERTNHGAGGTPPATPPVAASIAVVGAGLAGLACARVLADAGLRVTVFEKSRGPGGRTSTRREGALRFDHGTIDFGRSDLASVSPTLRTWWTAWERTGLVRPWSPRRRGGEGSEASPAWVAVPGNNAVAHALASGLDLRAEVRVAGLAREGAGWTVMDDTGQPRGTFDAVVVAAPAPQATELLRPVAAGIAAELGGVRLAPSLTAMVAWSGSVDPGWDLLETEPDDREDGIARVILQASLPERPGDGAFVVQASPAWTMAHLEDSLDDVGASLARALARRIGPSLRGRQPVVVKGHRWRYATVEEELPGAFRWETALQLAACGDAFGRGGAWGALESGIALGQEIRAWARAHAGR